jgi:hypothetical protein
VDVVEQLVSAFLAVFLALSPVLALGSLFVLVRRARRDGGRWTGSRRLTVALLVGYLAFYAALVAYVVLGPPGLPFGIQPAPPSFPD